jgi:hypothetical protein
MMTALVNLKDPDHTILCLSSMSKPAIIITLPVTVKQSACGKRNHHQVKSTIVTVDGKRIPHPQDQILRLATPVSN